MLNLFCLKNTKLVCYCLSIFFVSITHLQAAENNVKPNINHKSNLPYQTAKLVPVNTTHTLVLPIVSQPLQAAKLYSRMSGFIKQKYVDIGDHVNKNDLLATVDAPLVKAQERKILAEIANAEAQKELNQLNLQRAKQLAKDNLISQAEHDRLRILLTKSHANIDILKADLEKNQLRQSFLEIRAPFSGYIVSKNVEVGDLVSANNTQAMQYLYEIINKQLLRLVMHVPQNDIRYLSNGDNVTVKFTGYQGLKVTAKITRMAQAVDYSSGTMLVEAEFDNSSYNLPSGLRGTSTLTIKSTKNQLPLWQVPISAITYHQGTSAIVGIIGDQIQFYKINIISQSNQNVILNGPIADVEQVILNPNALLLK